MPTKTQITTATAALSSNEKWPPTAPNTLLAGDWHIGEFTAVRQAIDPEHRWPALPTLAETIGYLQTQDLPPEVVLLAQSRPGVDDQSAIDEICRLAPLTRVVVIAGSWCEGELRTGTPLTDVIRLYWYEFPAWWRAACQKFARSDCPTWSAPLVEVRSGQSVSLQDAEAHNRLPRGDAAVLIDAVDYAVFEGLAAGLGSLGWKCHWQPRHRPHLAEPSDQESPEAAIWDGGQLDAAEVDQLRKFCLRTANAPVIALLDFPRVEHLDVAKSAGAAAVFGKPYQLALVHNELLRLGSRN